METGKPGPTHSIFYVMSADMGGMTYGMFDATLPAGWTPENRDWCLRTLEAKRGRPVAIIGVTRFDR